MRCSVVLLLAVAAPLAATDLDMVVNEINYHPLGGDARAEFVELYNRGPTHVDLSGWYFESGVVFTFPPATVVEPEAFLVVCADPSYLATLHGISNVVGPWTGGLDDDGARMTLRRADGMFITSVLWGENAAWSHLADGNGATLELADPTLDPDTPHAWHASAAVYGTPGRRNGGPAPEDPPVRINEIGQTAGNWWAELYNRSGQPVDLGGYYLARSPDLSVRQRLPAGTVQDLVVVPLGFSVSLGEERCLLLAPDGESIVDVLAARAFSAWPGFGRFPDGGDDVYVFPQTTRGQPNLSPVGRDLFISEIMYHPQDEGNPPAEPRDLEYIGIAHRGTSAVDLSGWTLEGPVAFAFPVGSVATPGNELIVGADPVAIQQRYGIVGTFGPWQGELPNTFGTLALKDVAGNLVSRVTYARDGAWPAAANGQGPSLAVKTRNPAIDTGYGQAWQAAANGNPGTPPAENAIPPIVAEVMHDPPIPRSNETVRIACRINDSDPITAATLRYTIDGGGGTFATPLRDDGLSGDGAAGDSWWGATIGPFADGKVVAFHILATDQSGATTDAPGAGKDFLVLVSNVAPPASGSVSYRTVVTAATWSQLTTRPAGSNDLLDATFIGDRGEIFYNVGLRYGGIRTRSQNPKSFRIEFQQTQRFHGMKSLELSRATTNRQFLCYDFMERAGLPAPQVWMVNLWIHGQWDDEYLRVEAVDRDFATRLFGSEDGAGKLYRGQQVTNPSRSADLAYLGTDPNGYLPVYENLAGDGQPDGYEEVIRLCAAFSPAQTPDPGFPAAVGEVIDVDEWILFFAAQACISNNAPNIAADAGNDYFLYFRPSDGRAILMPGELESTFRDSGEPLFRPTVAAIRRFLTHPAFAPRYYGSLERLTKGAFARIELRQRVKLLKAIFDFGTRDADETYITVRLGVLFERLPIDVRGGVSGIGTAALIPAGDQWRYFKGTADPSGGDLAWTAVAFDDDAWSQAPAPIGYGDRGERTSLSDMRGNYTTLFVRHRFTVVDPGAVTALHLNITYDDGFVAYLNGNEVAAAGRPAENPPRYSSVATADIGLPATETIDLSGRVGVLEAGPNVLAIVGLNRIVSSSDFFIEAELSHGAGGAASGGGCGELCYVAGDTVVLSGRAPAASTRRVEVAGVEVPYDPVQATWEGTVALAPGENAIPVRALGDDDAVVGETTFAVQRVARTSTLTGTIGGNVTLTPAGGPYLLTGTLTVPAGRKLTIAPGSAIIAEPAASIVVEGLIEAVGTEADPIHFVGSRCSPLWEGIGMRDTGTAGTDPVHRFRYCTFRWGKSRSDFTAFLSPHRARLLVEHCEFRDIRSNAIDGVDAEMEIRNCFFNETYEAVHSVRSLVHVADCVFRQMIGDKDAVDFDYDGPGQSIIENCVIDGSMDDGFDLGGRNAAILNNYMINIQDKAISSEPMDAGAPGQQVFRGNVIARCGTAIALKSGAVCEDGSHNTIVGNMDGIDVYAKTPGAPGSRGVFHFSISWHNKENVYTDGVSVLTITDSDIGGDSVWPGAGNIREDPLFADESRGIFYLNPASPCILGGGNYMGALPACMPSFVRGDANIDRRIDLSDAIFTLMYVFGKRVTAECLDAADANDDGSLTVADPIYLLGYLYGGSSRPRLPFPEPGADPTADGLGCGSFGQCP